MVGGGAAGVSPPTVGYSPFPNLQTAPLTKMQLQGMGLTSGLTAPTQNYLGNMMNTSNYVGQGGLMNPASNPFVRSEFNTAAQPLIQQYEWATTPNLLQNMASSGTLGSSGFNQAMANNQTQLAQGLGNLGSGIYNNAYNTGLQAMMNAQQMAPGMAAGQYIPSGQLLNVGGQGQQQAQNILQNAYQNMYNQANWPMQGLQFLGNALNTASGGGFQGTTVATTPNLQSAGK